MSTVSPFSQVLSFFHLWHCVLSGAAFLRRLSSAHLLRLIFFFSAVPWGRHFTCMSFSFSPFPFVKVLCVQLFSCVHLRSFPPPLLRHLTSVITALDSSRDGKCFSIPLSPSLSLNLHRSLYLTKQITSWLL